MKKRQNITVELTPLLDVILIILFLIITENNAKSEELKSAAEKEISGYVTQIDSLKNSLGEKTGELNKKSSEIDEKDNIISGYARFDELSTIISVFVGKNYEKDGGRIIYISDGENTEHISFNWDNMRYAENSLKHSLSEKIKNASGNPVFITYNYDRDETYQRDYELISETLSEINEKYVFVSINEKTEGSLS